MLLNARETTRHCATCNCADEQPAQPSTSSPGIRRQVLEQTAAAVRAAKEREKR